MFFLLNHALSLSLIYIHTLYVMMYKSFYFRQLLLILFIFKFANITLYIYIYTYKLIITLFVSQCI